MARSISERRSAAAWRLARRQHGVVTREQLLTLGFTKSAIEHRIRVGRLHLVMRGVYTVGRPHLSREGRWMVAVLACGRHRRPSLPTGAITKRLNIPVTQPVQTFLDLATVAGPTTVERGQRGGQAGRNRCGLPPARTGPPRGRAGCAPSPSDPGQAHLSPFRRRAGTALPPSRCRSRPAHPAHQTDRHDFEVDFFWPNLGLVVETDGWRYHRTPAAQTRDALTRTMANLSGHDSRTKVRSP